MFEVERNFGLTKEESDRLLEGAAFKGEQILSDIYFDTADYELTKQDFWLRRRDGKFELKVPVAGIPDGGPVDQYQEIDTDAEIRAELGIEGGGTIADIISEDGFRPFCICTTTRKTYVNAGFTIVVDAIVYAGTPLTFTTCEIELLVERQEDIPAAAARVNAYAESCGLSMAPSHGKVIEYLRRECPEHFQALVDAGVLTHSTGS